MAGALAEIGETKIRYLSRSDRTFWIPLNNFDFEFRDFAPLPEGSAGSNPIPQGPSICSLAALQWPWDANELGFERISCGRYHRIAMAAHIDELHMGREVRVRLRARSLYISCLRILQARSHAVPQQHVDRRLRLLIVGSLS